MATIHGSVWRFAVGLLLGCGRSEPALVATPEVGGAGKYSAGAANGGQAGSGTTGGVGGRAGSATTGGAGGRAGSGTGGVAGRPVDPALAPPSLRLPQNGRATGSVWAERARRPRFVWDAQPGMTFEIEVDDSCEVGALESCEFSSPEWKAENLASNDVTPPQALAVSERAPVGRRYHWRVRSCTSAACSRWSMVRYVDVGRQRSDFDGDGYADVVLSNPGNSVLDGRVLVGFGPVPSRRVIVLEDAMRVASPDRFGAVAKALGDMDADGFADLLVTATGDSTNPPGNVRVFFGNARFADGARRQSLLLEDDGEGDRLGGVATSAGDVDADGMQDFVIDSHPPDPRLYRGAVRDVTTTKIPVVRSGETLYGVSAGDVTGDGYSDLFAFSVIRDSSYRGRYDLLRGSPAGLDDPAPLGSGEGFPVAAWGVIGDVNGDGFSDLALAVNEPADVRASRIDVSLGGETPVLEPAIQWAGGIAEHILYVDLGGPVAAGDVNGDGFEDSLVPFSWHTSDLVQANLYLGGLGSRGAPDAVYSFNTGLVLFVSTGLPLGPGDVNGDGFDDVFLSEDFGHTGKLFVGGSALDGVPDDELELPFP